MSRAFHGPSCQRSQRSTGRTSRTGELATIPKVRWHSHDAAVDTIAALERDLATEITAGATTDDDRLIARQDWCRAELNDDLPAATRADAIETFVRYAKRVERTARLIESSMTAAPGSRPSPSRIPRAVQRLHCHDPVSATW